MHHPRARLRPGQLFAIQAPEAEIFAGGGDEGAAHPFQLQPQHHHDVGILQAFAHVGHHFDAETIGVGGQQRAWRHQTHPRPHHRQQAQVGARDAAVQDIAADGDDAVLETAQAAADGQRVQQCLGGVFMGAVARVDHAAGKLARQKFRRTGILVAHDQDVGPHGVEGGGGVDQGLALGDRRGLDRHVHHIGAQPLARQLEAGLGPGRGLEEQVDQGAAPQQGCFFVRGAILADVHVS